MLRSRAVVAGAVAVAVVLALAVLLGQPARLLAPGLPPGASGNAPSGGGPSGTGASGSGLLSLGAPTEVEGLRVLSVSDALARRDAGSADRIAVLGWAVRFFVPCPLLADAYQPLENCVYRFSWLMADAERLNVANPDGSGSINLPVGPAFNTSFNPPDAGILQAVVVIGRFHDPRSALCPAGSRRDTCGRLFVADGAAWLGPTSTGAPPTGAPGQPPGASPSAQSSGAS